MNAGLIREAQDWERALASGGPTVNAEFAAWIRRSPEHLQAYLECLSLEKELATLDESRYLDLDALRAQISGNVVPIAAERLRPIETHPGRRGAYRVYLAACALAACTGLGLCVSLWHPRHERAWSEYVTVTGEQRRVLLPDGSVVEMNTQSKIRVSFLPAIRELELVSGEAAFTVQHDAARPFRVHAGGSWFEDVGTEFSVYLRNSSRTTVSVLSGRIDIVPDRGHEQSTDPKSEAPSLTSNAVPATLVSAGEQVDLDHGGRVVDVVKISVTEMAGWRQHRIWFDGASLEDVATEFNRYNTKKLRVESSVALAKKHYTATWDPYDPASFIEYLKSDPTLTIEWDGDRTVIRTRDQ